MPIPDWSDKPLCGMVIRDGDIPHFSMGCAKPGRTRTATGGENRTMSTVVEARRIKTRGQETRRRILDVAQESILAKGFDATSIEEIVAGAEITRSGFFYHFPDKNALARALLERYLEEDRAVLGGVFARAAELSDDPLQRFLIALRLLSEIMADLPNGHPGCLVATVCYQERLFDQQVRDLNRDSVLAWRRLFHTELTKVEARYPPRDSVKIEELADMISTVIEGGIILAKALRDPQALSRQITDAALLRQAAVLTRRVRSAGPALCVGAAHWDVIARADAPAPPGADRPGIVIRRPGGVALNVAVALARRGAPALLLAAVGEDPDGDALFATVAAQGVDVSAALRAGTPTDAYVAIEAGGELVAAVADCRTLEAAAPALLAALRAARGRRGPAMLDGNLPGAVLDAVAAEGLLTGGLLYVTPASPAKAARLARFISGRRPHGLRKPRRGRSPVRRRIPGRRGRRPRAGRARRPPRPCHGRPPSRRARGLRHMRHMLPPPASPPPRSRAPATPRSPP